MRSRPPYLVSIRDACTWVIVLGRDSLPFALLLLCRWLVSLVDAVGRARPTVQVAEGRSAYVTCHLEAELAVVRVLLVFKKPGATQFYLLALAFGFRADAARSWEER